MIDASCLVASDDDADANLDSPNELRVLGSYERSCDSFMHPVWVGVQSSRILINPLHKNAKAIPSHAVWKYGNAFTRKPSLPA